MIMDVGDDFRTLSKDGPLIGYGQDRLTVRSVKSVSYTHLIVRRCGEGEGSHGHS